MLWAWCLLLHFLRGRSLRGQVSSAGITNLCRLGSRRGSLTSKPGLIIDSDPCPFTDRSFPEEMALHRTLPELPSQGPQRARSLSLGASVSSRAIDYAFPPGPRSDADGVYPDYRSGFPQPQQTNLQTTGRVRRAGPVSVSPGAPDTLAERSVEIL